MTCCSRINRAFTLWRPPSTKQRSQAVSLLAAVCLVSASCAPAEPPQPTAAIARDETLASTQEIVGVSFEPLRSRRQTGDAVPHMELTGILFLPGDQGLLLWDKSGRLSHHALTPEGLVLLGELKLDGVYNADDCGLISVALDPEWESNGYLYAAACSSQTHSTVTRYQFHVNDYAAVNASAATVIILGDPLAQKPWHNIGSIGFFADAEQSMWILVGEKALPDRAQDLSTQLGSVLRIIPGREPTQAGYVPHPNNLFGGPDSDPSLTLSPEIYAWGFRSPWRGAVDDLGRLWIGDVGDAYEEINLVRAAGDNFGWSAWQGGCQDSACASMRDPVVYWGRDADHPYRVDDPEAEPSVLRVAWVGAPYQHQAVDPYHGFLDNSVLIADMCVGFVRAVGVDSEGLVIRDDHVGHLAGLSGAAQGPDGYLYVTAYGGCTSDSEGIGGRVLRVVPRSRASTLRPGPQPRTDATLAEEPLGPMPQQLSETGLFEDMHARLPLARAARYEPLFPLWTNGADKERWLLLPLGTQVENIQAAPWEFPVGSVFGKTFAYPTDHGVEPVETRIIRRTLHGWDYHAYRWIGDDAELLSLERTIYVPVVGFGEQLWHAVPSRFECRTCHESHDTPVIGFDELRLNGHLAGANQQTQLQSLYAQGALRFKPPEPAESISASDALTFSVLGYLHGNCAHCHNDSPNSMSPLDLRHSQALTQLINVPTQGSGQLNGIRVTPGAPEQSVLYQSLVTDGSLPELRVMPPLGVQRPDTHAAALIEHWIRNLP